MSESKDRPPEDEDEVRPDEDAAAPEDDGAAGESDPARSAVQIIDRRGDGATSGGPPVPTPPDPTVDEALLDDLISDEVPAQDDVEDGAEAAGAGAGMEDDGAEAALAPEPPARPRGPENLVSVLESLLFVADRPLSIRDLKAACGRFVKTADIRDAIETIAGDYAHGDRGIVLIEVASGWQFRSNPQNREWVHRFLAVKPQRLSRAALETLAIIAYRQPAVRAEIEDVRGVDSSAAIKKLLERGLIRILGRKEEVGHPLVYGTSREFLEFFGLRDLSSLPTLKDLEELGEERQEQVEEALAVEFPESAMAEVDDALEPGEAEAGEARPEGEDAPADGGSAEDDGAADDEAEASDEDDARGEAEADDDGEAEADDDGEAEADDEAEADGGAEADDEAEAEADDEAEAEADDEAEAEADAEAETPDEAEAADADASGKGGPSAS